MLYYKYGGQKQTTKTLLPPIGQKENKMKFEEMKITKTKEVSRGYGECRLVIFKYNGEWCFKDVIYADDGEWQSDCVAPSHEELAGKTIKELRESVRYSVLSGNWHNVEFDKDGEVISVSQ